MLPHSASAPQPADLICLSISSHPLFNTFLCKTGAVWWLLCSPGRWQNWLQIQLGRGRLHAAEDSSKRWQDGRAGLRSAPSRATWTGEFWAPLRWPVWTASLASWRFQPQNLPAGRPLQRGCPTQREKHHKMKEHPNIKPGGLQTLIQTKPLLKPRVFAELHMTRFKSFMYVTKRPFSSLTWTLEGIG